jgi:hypothetical protein
MTQLSRLTLFLSLLLFGCSAPVQQPAEQQPVQQLPEEAENEEDALPAPAEQTIAAWVDRNLGIQLKDETFEKAGITDLARFTTDIDPKLKSDLFDAFYLGDKEQHEVKVHPGVIHIDVSTADQKDLFITEHYIIISAHLSMGNNGSSLLYDLKTRKLERLNMNVAGFIEPHLLDVWFDYYEDAHVWEYGKYDIRTKKYTRIRKEN